MILTDNRHKYEVIIYGAGYCGLMFSDLLLENGIKPYCFFDKDENKTGQSFNESKIVIPQPIPNHMNDLVIVCILNTNLFHEIINFLQKLGYKNVISIFDLCDDSKLFKNQPLIFYIPKNWYLSNYDCIKSVRSLLEDNLSKTTYDKVIDFVCGNNYAGIPACSMKEQYFAYDVYKKVPDEVFLDCGAFRGDILRYFIENNSSFLHYFAIEPDPQNYTRIEIMPQTNDKRVSVIKYAISDKKEFLKVRNFLNENSVISINGDTVVPALTLDDIYEKYEIDPTFIKIDVEGYERQLILGAINTFSCSNVIAVAIYHKPDDLWELPLILHRMLPDHKLYIRSYLNINETILYVVPSERCVKQ